MKKIIIAVLALCLIGLLFLSACSNIESALESKEKKCEREKQYCKAECNSLSDVFGCSSKCEKRYEACVL